MPDNTPQQPVVLSLVSVGTPLFPRYMLSDKHGRVWTGADWTEDEEDGLLYACINSAGRAIQELLKKHCSHKNLTRYVAPIYLDLYCDHSVPKVIIEDWLYKVARLIVDAPTHGNGPMDGTLGLLQVEWTKLRKIP